MLEATGRLQKCRLYEMSNNKAFRATVSYLIVRDLVHEKVFAKALETLGVNWGKALPVPRINTDKMPEVKDLAALVAAVRPRYVIRPIRAALPPQFIAEELK